MRRVIWVLGGVLVMLLLAGCARSGPPGVIEGRVTVGPLTLVERAPEPGLPTPTVPPQVYTSRKLNIYHADGKRLVREVSFQGDGTYRVEIEPGDYVLALPPGGIEHAQGLPRSVTVRSGQVVRVDIDIDTGIR